MSGAATLDQKPCARTRAEQRAGSLPDRAASDLIRGAPDWRPFAPSSQAVPYRTPQIRLARHERDWFFWLAYSAGLRPGALLRQFAEAYANGAPVPRTELGEPKNKLRLIPPSDMVAHSFPLAVESARRAYERAHADGLSLSGVMRRFVVDYVRTERAARASGGAPVSRSRSGRSVSKPLNRAGIRPARWHVRAGLSVFPQITRPTKSANDRIKGQPLCMPIMHTQA